MSSTPGPRPLAPLTALPPAARRWLARAIAPGSEPIRLAELSMHGSIRIGRWRPFRARQVIDPAHGYVWTATAGRPPMVVRGFDRYADGDGEMRWRLFGLIPIMSATGPDVSRSAAGRFAGEIVLCPTAALAPNVEWRPGADDDHAVADVRLGDRIHTLTIEVGGEGSLRRVELPRWGSPDGGPCRLNTFGVTFAGEIASGGYAIPATMRAGWRLGEGGPEFGESFRATIDAVAFERGPPPDP